MSDDWGNRTVLEKTLQKEVTKLSAMLVESADMIERWKERAERLRAEMERLKNEVQQQMLTRAHEAEQAGKLIVTDEQIDKAWRYSRCGTLGQVVRPALAFLGIVACPKCGGTNRYTDPYLNYQECECPSCSNNGWIREERGDE